MDIAVYLFTGFLEAGKTTLIQETLEDEKFNSGESTLILSCEEGVEELDPSAFAAHHVAIESIDMLSQLNPDKLAALQKKHNAVRILVEYNGMWMNGDFFAAMPEGWFIYQEIFLADAKTFANYNQNMRTLTVDKLQTCEMVVFNRCDENTDRMALHKIVRGITRQANIAYENAEHEIEYDDIEDPLPFDLSADIVEIADRDYALFYRDMSEDMEKYKGKTLRMKGIVARDPKLPVDSFAFGRHVMTCCENDITYRGLVCKCKGPCQQESKDWIILTARLDIEYHKLYRSKGPVLKAISIEKTAPLPPDEQVATFY